MNSALRAFIGLGLYAIAVLFEQGEKRYHLLAATALVMAIIWPGCWLGPSFQLTYAALFGIYIGTKDGRDLSLKSFLLTNIFASLFTAVVAGVWFSRISLLGLILNPIFSSFASFVSCKFGFIALLAKILGIDPFGWGLQVVSWALLVFRDLIESLFSVSWLRGLSFEVSFLIALFLLISFVAGTIYFSLRNYFREYNCYTEI